MHVPLHTKGVKLGFNKKIGHVNKSIIHINKTIQYEELESTNLTATRNKEDNKYKETSSVYDIKGEEKASIKY